MRAQIRAGATAGKVSLDELFQLGVERDNDLWLRGHTGTTDGRKGAAPLGRRYLLANWEMAKNIYENGLFTMKLGPFLDSGAIADSSGLFASQRWQWDSGLQCKVRILGGVTAVFSYGRNLRGGKGAHDSGGDFVVGVYPLLPDETCWFLAADFDEESWAADALAVLETCQAKGVPAALERSRSGNGGHVWIFFSEPVSARTARQLGAAMLTETMERRPEIGFASYDRFFPSQDTMPKGGFGISSRCRFRRSHANWAAACFSTSRCAPMTINGATSVPSSE